MGTIEDILSDEVAEPIEEAAVEAVETVETPEAAPVDTVRDEKGRFAPKGVDDGAPPAPVDKLPPEEFKALKEERTKRQTLEQELAEIRRQLEASKAPPPPAPDLWEDTQGWQQHFGGEVVTAAVQQASLNAKLDMSEMMVRQANPDFEDVKAEFLALAQQNPDLTRQALADPHPWNKAYQIAKNHKTMTELGATDLDTLKTKLREEIMAEMAATTPAKPGLPPTLTGMANVGSRGGPEWAGPRPLEDLLR